MNFDILVVGCGLTGSVVARFLAEHGKKVLIWERRDHIAGNMYDEKDINGILIHKYGPHTFHTNQKSLYEYMLKYESWCNYKLTCMSYMQGKYTPSPFNFRTIDDFYSADHAAELKSAIQINYPDQENTTIVELLKNKNPLIRNYANFLFEKDYKLYTAKQWGISPSDIDISVLKRVPIRFSYKVGYFDDIYQIMPKHSYTAFFENILNHPNIKIELNTDALEYLCVNLKSNKILLNGKETQRHIIYTGALDELFNCCYGPLPYRSLRFELQTLQMDSYQDAPVVAYPEAEGYTRITEYKKLPVQDIPGKTTIAIEYPLPYRGDNTAEPYYPILTKESKEAYQKYLKLAKQIPNLTICGRLADFQYYNMDQALARALKVCQDIIPS